jgi:glycosyltransferase involved in cell wall biosynthesis
MPTRNRAHLLRYSLQSALEQTFDDYEIVVSDNYSSDDTAKVVQELADRRVRYVRTDRALSLPDNWEFALTQAKGRYVTYLPDDDAFSPELLGTAAKVIEGHDVKLVAWPHCHYYNNAWYDPLYKNALLVPPFTAQVYDLDANKALTDWFTNFDSRALFPTPTNSVYPYELIHRVRLRVSRLMPVLACDVFLGVLMLIEVGRYSYVDSPMVLFSLGNQSFSISLVHNRGDASTVYLEEFPDQRDLRHVPLKTLVRVNYVAEALLEAKNVAGDGLRNVELNWETYFIGCYQDLMRLSDNKADVSKDLEEFHRVLAQQPLGLQRRVQQAIESSRRGNRASWRKAVRRLINSSSVLTQMELLLRPQVKEHKTSSLIRGEDAGFTNILECARKLEAVLRF